jgi:hypothetical protein
VLSGRHAFMVASAAKVVGYFEFLHDADLPRQITYQASTIVNLS